MTNGDKYLKDGVSAKAMWYEFKNWYNNTQCTCAYGEAIEIFMKEQAKPTLTEDERVILKQLNKWFIIIGKTEHGCIMVQDKCQGNEKHFGVTFDLLFAELFKWIQPRRRI